jgi:pilus assembly protein CpaB
MLGVSGARAVVLGISVVTMLVAYLFFGNPPAPPVQVVAEAPQQARTVEVAVAAGDLPLGNALAASDLRWIAWPEGQLPPGAVTRAEQALVEREIIGSLVRFPFVANEPIRREKLIRPDGSGFLAAMLPPGKRAVAINTERTGGSTAGGFILPNDRVDVVKTGRQEAIAGAPETFISETILSNVRVLAIGQAIREKDGKPDIVGDTATLELDPRQVEVITLAQRSGTLSLALRSLADANETQPAETGDRAGGLTLVRFGVTTQSPR